MNKRLGIQRLTSEDVMLIFTTSPAGLGHVRVMEALRSYLPQNIRNEVLGIDDKRVQMMHRITSQNIYLRKIMEFLQTNMFTEKFLSMVYTWYLRKRPKVVYFRLLTLIKRRRPHPKTIVIVATHVSLAHQIAQIKSKLSFRTKAKVILCVVVTDDTPLIIWAVRGADMVFVPSQNTTKYLSDYAKVYSSDERPKFILNAYPVSSKFSESTKEDNFKLRLDQLSKKEKPLNIIIPVSGAAVSLEYLKEIISYVSRKRRALVTVVSRESSYTTNFLTYCESIYGVTVIADTLDRDVVASYENALISKVYSLEITKPSEQAFKILLNPNQVGGVIMLFSHPVGRQEYDNVAFMHRHGLIPDLVDQKILDDLLLAKDYEGVIAKFGEKATCWRGLMLPPDSLKAGKLILRYKNSGILKLMSRYNKDNRTDELSSYGVDSFWEKVSENINDKN